MKKLVELMCDYSLGCSNGKLVLMKKYFEFNSNGELKENEKTFEFDNFICSNNDKYLELKISKNEFVTLSINEKNFIVFTIEKKDKDTNLFNEDVFIKFKGNEMIHDLYKNTYKELK